MRRCVWTFGLKQASFSLLNNRYQIGHATRFPTEKCCVTTLITPALCIRVQTLSAHLQQCNKVVILMKNDNCSFLFDNKVTLGGESCASSMISILQKSVKLLHKP